MDMPQLLKGVAGLLRTIPEIRDVQYPVSSQVTKYPAALVFSGSPDTAWTITYEPGGQLWLGEIYVQVLTARLGEITKEIATIDALIFALVDRFAVDATGHNPELPGVDQHVDRCRISRIRPNIAVGYAGSDYTAVELFLDTKFKRVVP